jgi:hypothetical protein
MDHLAGERLAAAQRLVGDLSHLAGGLLGEEADARLLAAQFPGAVAIHLLKPAVAALEGVVGG